MATSIRPSIPVLSPSFLYHPYIPSFKSKDFSFTCIYIHDHKVCVTPGTIHHITLVHIIYPVMCGLINSIHKEMSYRACELQMQLCVLILRITANKPETVLYRVAHFFLI